MAAADLDVADSCFCTLLCCGEARATAAAVVDSSPWQTTIACPAECGITASGSFVDGGVQLACPEFDVACEAEDGEPRSCRVVFYTVDPQSVVPEQLPEARQFRDLRGQVTRPFAQALAECYYGAAEMDALHVQTMVPGQEAVGYYEVAIGEERSLFLHNSLLLLPNFLSHGDCHSLRAAADQRLAQPEAAKQVSRASDGYAACREGLDRLPVAELGPAAQAISDQILGRLLHFFESIPALAQQIFQRSEGLAKLRFTFASGEPAVNRYEAGGGFGPHTDKEMVTVNIVLSEPDAFSGGGTMFWPEGASVEELVLLRPQKGVAVLFHGQLKHAGRAVARGLRHLYVASFSLTGP
ncbi:HGT1 [Symbiodinium natans]|uniref:HGT1 protein n=1 Tax=Symbiodinium natans TaxID=878477 RepID=A0A812K1I9_9DINO|nr:HGT1 [Symbiodinium natans]